MDNIAQIHYRQNENKLQEKYTIMWENESEEKNIKSWKEVTEWHQQDERIWDASLHPPMKNNWLAI